MAYAIVMKPGLAIFATLGVLLAQNPDAAAFNPPWTPAETIQVGDLLKIFQKKNGTPIFYVGFAQLYKSKHIPGSIYAGPGRAEEGLAELKKAVAKVPKDSEIVLYCGCCPWDHCPNMKPAYKLLHSLGYTKVFITEIPAGFQKDWIEKGYPVEGNSAPNGN